MSIDVPVVLLIELSDLAVEFFTLSIVKGLSCLLKNSVYFRIIYACKVIVACRMVVAPENRVSI